MVSFVINHLEYIWMSFLAILIALFLALVNCLVALGIQGMFLACNYENYAIASL